MDRFVDALDGAGSDIGAAQVDSLAELLEDVFADQNLSRLRHALHTRRAVHAVPVEIPVVRNGDVTEVDAYA